MAVYLPSRGGGVLRRVVLAAASLACTTRGVPVFWRDTLPGARFCERLPLHLLICRGSLSVSRQHWCDRARCRGHHGFAAEVRTAKACRRLHDSAAAPGSVRRP